MIKEIINPESKFCGECGNVKQEVYCYTSYRASDGERIDKYVLHCKSVIEKEYNIFGFKFKRLVDCDGGGSSIY